jgi:hypothetical protein
MELLMPTTRITVDEYEQMVDSGLLSENERVELIRGEIVARGIVNIPEELLEVYRGPQPDGTYRDMTKLGRGQSTGILGLPGIIVAVDDMF